MSVFISIPKKGSAKECSNYRIIALISHASKVMLKILQARLQQYIYHELPDVKPGYYTEWNKPERKTPIQYTDAYISWGRKESDTTERVNWTELNWTEGHNSCSWGSPCPCTLGTTRVPLTQAAVPLSWSSLTGAELPQAKKKSLASMHVESLLSCPKFCKTVDRGLPGFSVSGVL